MYNHKIDPAMLEDAQGQPFVHRDISWLSFNYRVLQEAMDPSVPLLERLKFLAIYSSNLDEFFRIRMANHRNLLRVGRKTKKELDVPPKTIVREIQKLVSRQMQDFSRIFDKLLVPELQKHNIHILRRLNLNNEQIEFIESYFQDHMMPFTQPVLLWDKKVKPFLGNGALYLAILMRDLEKPDTSAVEYGVLNIPSNHLPRFVKLPSQEGRHDIIMLDDIVRHSVKKLFPGFEILDTYSVKLTRDAELYIDDEFSGDLVAKIRDSLSKRQVGPASRFVYDREIQEDFLAYLMDVFELDKYDLLREGRYHNNADFFRFPDFGMPHLKYPSLPPLPYVPLEKTTSVFREIDKKDHVIHMPYHSYDSLVKCIEEASKDPGVTHIKVIQYRVARKSRIMNALMDAAFNGKQVSVFIEVKARFDEANNLDWGEKLEKAGVQVRYSFPGVKVHAKVALIRRITDGNPKLYCYLATGNFNEDTAKIYSDFGLFTADPRLTSEASRLFTFLETGQVSEHGYEHMLVGQFNLRSGLEALIDFEIAEAKAGRPAFMILKMNSLQDQRMINKLYEASGAGVQIKLIIRGICSLVPQMPGFSENIEAISIVDRFLEHARVFIFHHAGEEKIYLSSADWMERNLSYRVETAFPVYDEAVRKVVKDSIQMQLNDNVKARMLDMDLNNEYCRHSSDLPFRSQMETYYYFKRKMEQEK